MADGTRLFQITESVKECQDTWAQQQLFNTNFEQKIEDLTHLFRLSSLTRTDLLPSNHRMTETGVIRLLSF